MLQTTRDCSYSFESFIEGYCTVGTIKIFIIIIFIHSNYFLVKFSWRNDILCHEWLEVVQYLPIIGLTGGPPIPMRGGGGIPLGPPGAGPGGGALVGPVNI